MDRNRLEQIALLLIKNKFQREGRISWERRQELRREIEDEAKAMGIPAADATEFASIVAI